MSPFQIPISMTFIQIQHYSYVIAEVFFISKDLDKEHTAKSCEPIITLIANQYFSNSEEISLKKRKKISNLYLFQILTFSDNASKFIYVPKMLTYIIQSFSIVYLHHRCQITWQKKNFHRNLIPINCMRFIE